VTRGILQRDSEWNNDKSKRATIPESDGVTMMRESWL